MKAILWATGVVLIGFWPAIPMLLGFDSGRDSSIQALPALLFFSIPMAIVVAGLGLMIHAFRQP